jgi:hypothetical protein
MLRALCALAIAAPLTAAVAATPAEAITVKVRVEVPGVGAGFIPRTAVTFDETKTVTNGAATCPGTSPAAALNAATNGDWAVSSTATADPATFAVSRIKNTSAPTTANPWTWVAYVNQRHVDNLCTTTLNDGDDLLLYPWCAPGHKQGACYAGGPLYMRFEGQTFYAIDPKPVGLNNPVIVYGVESPAPDKGTSGGNPSTDSTLTTDTGFTAKTDNFQGDGTGQVQFDSKGAHSVTISEADKVPDRAAVCASQGGDGFCGSTPTPALPFNPSDYPSPCETNGHDGLCGTQDTTGPAAHVLNITNNKVFGKRKGPGQITGHLDDDVNGVGAVKLRLTRVATRKVLVKSKKKSKHKSRKKRYRTVKTCSMWNAGTKLIQSAKCGTKYGQWWEADLGDNRYDFSYHFALTLPSGTYVLEVQATDENGSIDPPEPGRNVIKFTVK